MNLSALSMGLTRPQISGGYAEVRDAAIAAARANNAALWYAGAPSDLTGFVYQDSSATTPATGTDPIGYLRDRANNLYPATQATAANKPTLELQPNGYYGMRFDGVSDGLTGPTPSVLPTAETFVWAGSMSRVTGFQLLIDRRSIAENKFLALRVDSGVLTAYIGYGGGFDSVNLGAVSLNTPFVVTGVLKSGGSYFRVNGVQVGTNSRAGTIFANTSVPVRICAAEGNAENAQTNMRGAASCFAEIDAAGLIAIERYVALLSGSTYP